jgi:hypothetical protein
VIVEIMLTLKRLRPADLRIAGRALGVHAAVPVGQTHKSPVRAGHRPLARGIALR